MLKSLVRSLIVFRKYRGRLVVSQVLVMVSALSILGVATLTQLLINEGIEAGSGEAVLRIGFWMLILAVIAGAAMAGAASLAVFFSQGTAYVIRTFVYRKVQTFSFENFDRFRTGNLLVRLNADVVNIQNAVLYMTMLLFYAPFMLIIAFILTLIRTPDLFWVLLLVSLVVIGIMAVLVPRVFRAYDERQERLDTLNNTLQENLAGVRVVKAFTREEFEIERFDGRADAMRQPAYQASWQVGILNPLLIAIAQLALALAIWVGGTQVLTGTGLDVGQLISFTQYLSLVVTPLALLAVVVPLMLRGDASAARILEVYDARPAVQEPEKALPLEKEAVKGRVVFENVTFAYRRPGGELDPPVLKNINLTIEPGQRIGFLGATGAGKSSLINLIPRFYDVTEGRITIDGVDVREVPSDRLRQVVGIALQEALLFQGDVRFNLKFGNPNVEDDVMVEAAKAADTHGFVTNLPEHWEAPVARRGYNFSGGQRQRLCISRTLTALPRVLVLDDSTSALDASTEARVQEAIPLFTNHVTTIYVAQRISAVIDLDCIYLLENGEIVAAGTHDELLASNALYQEIYESQLGSGITADLPDSDAFYQEMYESQRGSGITADLDVEVGT